MIFPLPEIDRTKPLYIYGAGIMGVSYKRQIEQLGMKDLLLGFVEDQPSLESYLGVPVIKRGDLTARQLAGSQFLIASHRLVEIFERNLIAQGCGKENIIYPLSLAWKGRSVLEGITSDRSVCVYPVVSNCEDLHLVCDKARKKQSALAGRGITLHVTVVVDAALDVHASMYPWVKLIGVSRREMYPSEVLDSADMVLITHGRDLAGIDVAYHGKVYLYGISVLGSFARRVKGYLAANQPRRHKKLINKLKEKGCLKVVFLAIHSSVWKVDSVFKKMLASPLFDPLIVICPYVSYGDERMWEDMRQSRAFFEGKGYPFISSYNSVEKRWLRLEEVDPDIVFFTNPHNLTRREYYQDAYLEYLSCYVPYHHEVCRYGGDVAQYNQNFHNALWKIFVPHEYSFATYKNVSVAKGVNVVVSGYPAMEEVIEKKKSGHYSDVWKSRDDRRRIIWAPHHTIVDVALPYSNFLKYAQAFRELSTLMRHQVVWSFKPHPLLKLKLYKHASWGREKTDAYYDYWASQSYTQLDEGDYTDLFLSADAMVHDSGSFLAEFLYLEKPVMYLLSENNQGDYHSDFGIAALEACEKGYCFDDVVRFVTQLVSSESRVNNSHRAFLAEEVAPYFDGDMPSDRIINEIVRSIS